MSAQLDAARFDFEVRRYVYDRIITQGHVPEITEVATALGTPRGDIKVAFGRLSEARVLVLQEATGEILMANPFSAVPTPFPVEMGGRSWWGNCIWDALGIIAMVGGDGRITTGCGNCNDAMRVAIKNGDLAEGTGIIHISVPAKQWWDNIKFT